jgi:hypothetical protein
MSVAAEAAPPLSCMVADVQAETPGPFQPGLTQPFSK